MMDVDLRHSSIFMLEGGNSEGERQIREVKSKRCRMCKVNRDGN